MRSYRKKQVLVLILLLVAVFGISIGFAAFSSSLNITPEVGVTPNAGDFSVKFSTTQDSLTVGEVEPYSMSDGITATNAMIDNSGIPTIKNMSAVYTGPGDYVTYRFYVRNDGEYIAYLNSITFNNENNCSEKIGTTASQATDACNDIIMTVKVGEVSVTETTLNILDETLNPGESKIVEVTVKYSDNGYIPDGDFSLKFGTVSLYYASTGGINEPGDCKYTTDSDGNQMVTCGTENFYVLSNDGTKVEMLSKYNLTLSTTNPVQATTDAVNPISFSTTNYWLSDVNDYPAYMYNENSNIYQYVEAYRDVLEETGITVLDAKLISYEQLEKLNCSGDNSSCSSAPKWVYLTSYWTGSVASMFNTWIVYSYGSFNQHSYLHDKNGGIRPVITIPVTEIES